MMRIGAVTAVIASLLFLCAGAAAPSALELSDATFERTVLASGKPFFVMFYMPWCGHCKEMLPVWHKLTTELAGEAGVAQVNLEKQTGLQWRFRRQVRGFPTMLLFRDGKFYTYSGTRDIDLLRKFVRGDWSTASVEDGAQAPVPPSWEEMDLSSKVLEVAGDFYRRLGDDYAGIWTNHRDLLLAAVSTAFSLGGIFGFAAKILIDWAIPPLPPKPRKAKQT
ncbi:thioredoxin-like protein [Baffinella frigidus]|nr:thioredoxin-like protein [Cryptophyta sp. CCMP2293]